MTNSMMELPIILTGRGGSGTRLLSLLAMDAGIFLGNELNKSYDSIEWVPLVYKMVVESGDKSELPSGSSYRQNITRLAQEIVGRADLQNGAIWGWKLPETMVLLPLFMDAFPRAKVVHFIRHPVTLCLRRTHMSSRLGNTIGNILLPAAYRYAGRDPSRILTDADHLHNAYAWDYQVARITRYGRDVLGADQYMELKYEQVCSNPRQALITLSAFIGTKPCNGTYSLTIDEHRQRQFDPDDSRIGQVWDICSNTAKILGYSLGEY